MRIIRHLKRDGLIDRTRDGLIVRGAERLARLQKLPVTMAGDPDAAGRAATDLSMVAEPLAAEVLHEAVPDHEHSCADGPE